MPGFVDKTVLCILCPPVFMNDFFPSMKKKIKICQHICQNVEWPPGTRGSGGGTTSTSWLITSAVIITKQLLYHCLFYILSSAFKGLINCTEVLVQCRLSHHPRPLPKAPCPRDHPPRLAAHRTRGVHLETQVHLRLKF